MKGGRRKKKIYYFDRQAPLGILGIGILGIALWKSIAEDKGELGVSGDYLDYIHR